MIKKIVDLIGKISFINFFFIGIISLSSFFLWLVIKRDIWDSLDIILALCASLLFFLVLILKFFAKQETERITLKDMDKMATRNYHNQSLTSSYLNSIEINNYFSIKEIKLFDLKDKKEIYFIGKNGDGKTVLLQAMLLALKKTYAGRVIEYIRDIEDEMSLMVNIEEFPNEYHSDLNIKNVFAYGVNRNKIDKKFDKYGYMGLFDSSDFRDTTYLKDPIDILLKKEKLVEQFIKVLNTDILLDNLEIKRDRREVYFLEDSIKVDFETLSEGYKSTIIWVCDLFSRLIENDNRIKKLSDFKAIVLIDEIDLYLHPKWKYDFVYNLRKVFPNIQFIMITHSTATILGASEDAVFYKVYKENGETKISHPMDSIKNLMANNLSTSPLFDMETARARNSDENIDTSEDFIYTKIHERIAERVKGKKAILEDDIIEMINKELDDYLKDNN